jgi:hypothetical protein
VRSQLRACPLVHAIGTTIDTLAVGCLRRSLPKFAKRGIFAEHEYEAECWDLVRGNLIERDDMVLLKEWDDLTFVAVQEELSECLDNVRQVVCPLHRSVRIKSLELPQVTPDRARPKRADQRPLYR